MLHSIWLMYKKKIYSITFSILQCNVETIRKFYTKQNVRKLELTDYE